MPRIQSDPIQIPPLFPQKDSSLSLNSRAKHRPFWQKIRHVAYKVCGIACCGKGLDNLFDPSEIGMLRNDRPLPPQLPPQMPHRTIMPIQIMPNEDVVFKSDEFLAPPPKQFDETLENARGFVRDLVNLVLDEIDKKNIEPQIEAFRQIAPSFPPLVKSVAKLLIEMGDKAAKPLFRKLALQKTEVIDPALSRMLKTLLKTNNNNLSGDLFQYLKSELEGIRLPQGQKPLDYIKPIMNWIGGESPSLATLFPADGTFDSHLIDTLCEKAQAFYQTYNVPDLDRLYYRMEYKLNQELKDTKIPKGQDLDANYIKPILNWLLCSDQSAPISSLFQPPNKFDEDLIDKVFENAIIYLVERKIDHYVNILDKTLRRRLGEIVENTIRKNVLNTADYFSVRFSELITNMPYTQTVDNIVKDTVAKQIEGYILAAKAVENHKSVLIKARQAIKLDANTPAQFKLKKEAEEHLSSVQNHGGEEKFLYNMFLEEFSKQPCCNPNIKKIVEQHLYNALQNKDSNHAIPGIENGIFELLADGITQLFLPTRKIILENGRLIETDPLVDLWNQMYLPEEFYELMRHMEELASEFITPEIVSLFASVKQPILEGLEKLAMTLAQELLKKQLVSIIKKSFNLITIPENFDVLNAESTLPEVNEQMLKTLMKMEINRNLKQVTSLMQDLILAIPAQRDIEFKKVQHELVTLAKSKFDKVKVQDYFIKEIDVEGEAQLEYSDLTDEYLENLIKPIIEKYEQTLKSKMREPSRIHPALTKKEIETTLQKFQEDDNKESNPIYGEIVMNLIFKMGEWKNEGTIGFFIRDSISKGATGSIADFRDSYHYLINLSVDILKSIYLNPKKIEELISHPPKPDSKLTKEKLQHQIKLTAKIAHDMVIGIAGDQGRIAKFAAKKYLNDDPKTLVELINKIYGKLFGDHILNQNIMMQMITEIFKGLTVASDKIRSTEALNATHSVTRL